MNKLRIGVIGCSQAAAWHIAAYRNNPECEVAALCDLSEDRLAAARERYQIPLGYTDTADMLAKANLDAVSICTPNAAHAANAAAALKAGAHVLCEKPLARTLPEALAMERAADESGRLLAVGLVRRFGRDARAAGELVESGALGDLYYARVSYLRRAGHPGSWFGRRALSGGGALIDLGIHVIDLAWYLMGRPAPLSASAVGFNRLGERRHIRQEGGYRPLSAPSALPPDTEELSCVLIRFANGAAILCESSYSANLPADEQRVQLCGTRGGCEIAPEVTLVREAGDRLVSAAVSPGARFVESEAFGGQIDHFIACIRGREAPVNGAGDGVALMRMIDAAYRSAESGRVEPI